MNTETNYELKHVTSEDIKNGNISLQGENEEKKLITIEEEFRNGIDGVKDLVPSVTFYGSVRIKEGAPEYVKAYKLAYRIGKELGYAILTGGGAGIMQAANHGAFDAGVPSLGLTIKLPFEQKTNPYVTKEIPFHFFFARQVSLSYSTEVCIFCPGGFGTMYEFFEMINLLQTGKIGKMPVILYDSEYWNPIHNLIKEQFAEKYKTINPDNMNLYTITDDENLILDIIKKSKERNGEDDLI